MREIFFDVLEINIAVSVIFLVLFLLSGKLRKRYGAVWMKLVWILLAVRLLIPYNFSLPNTEIRLFREDLEQKGNDTVNMTAANGILPAGENITGNISGANDAEIYSDGTTGMVGASDASKVDNITEISPAVSDAMIVDGNKSEDNRQGESALWRKMISGGEILPLIWIIGVGVGLVYCLAGYVCFLFHCRKKLLPITDINLRKQIMGVERKFNGKADIPCYQDQRTRSPMLAGFFMPKLILPADKKRWTQTELELVIAHELCHYKHKDLWLKLLMTAAWCVNWFNPLVWMLKKQFFYELELACDGSVLADYDEEIREDYARIMLSFAGKKGAVPAFTTGFGESKKQMKRRIDYMLDVKEKKKGMISIVMTCILVLAVGLLISCGSKPEEENILEEQDEVVASEGQENSEVDALLQGEMEQSASEGSVVVSYSLNNEYNEMIRFYGSDIYISREDGIYRLSDDGESEELLFANDYRLRRGMEIYQDSLYFCGSAERGNRDAATIYRMDLNSYEVKDALALFSQVFEALCNITIYDGELYVANAYSVRSGFELDENGEIIKMLDEEAEDFLFKEDNEYWNLQLKIWNNEVVFDTEEYWETVEQMSGMYRNIIDAAACEKMLSGNQVVARYKNELLSSIYLKKEDGTYEFLCDTIGYPVLVTETGVYYFPDEGFAIWYVDYETKVQQKIWEKESRSTGEIQLVNYDQGYIYFVKSNRIGRYQDNAGVYENYLMRVPRWTEGSAEKVYRFEMDMNLGSLQRSCAVAGDRMFFNEYETISLDPAVNGMERENRGEPSEDAAAMRQSVEGFAEAYFQNDEERLKAYLSESFEGAIDLYPYPEQSDQIEELYISGLPDGELPVGVICFVSYEFSGNGETDALSYLSIEMEKTGQGWKILSYGLEG